MKKIAVVIANLGGPQSADGVKPFLLSLFSDPRITRVHPWLRKPLAHIISAVRASKSRGIYAKGSPLLKSTEEQARALEAKLSKIYNDPRVFVYMRHSGPSADAVLLDIKAYGPDQVVLLPLYPQFSTSTTLSVFDVWDKLDIGVPLLKINDFYDDPMYIRSYTRLLRTAYEFACSKRKVRVIFSAHGVPKSYIAAGDVYEKHIHGTVDAMIKCLGVPNLDWRLAYQSRVGFAAWLSPYIQDEIVQAGKEGLFIVLVPVSFVSENIEVVDELDREIKELAMHSGASGFFRVSTPGTDDLFIEALAGKVVEALKN